LNRHRAADRRPVLVTEFDRFPVWLRGSAKDLEGAWEVCNEARDSSELLPVYRAPDAELRGHCNPTRRRRGIRATNVRGARGEPISGIHSEGLKGSDKPLLRRSGASSGGHRRHDRCFEIRTGPKGGGSFESRYGMFERAVGQIQSPENLEKLGTFAGAPMRRVCTSQRGVNVTGGKRLIDPLQQTLDDR
jgi:hypothetical protein